MTRSMLFFAALAGALCVSAPAIGQTTRYNPGERVQCDLTRMSKWESGTVLSAHDEVWGTYYKVKIDGDSSPSWNCHPEYMRPAPAPVASSPSGASAGPATAPRPAPAAPDVSAGKPTEKPVPASTRSASPPGASGNPPSGGGLRVGEYACYGSNGPLIGLGFKVVAPGRTTDLDGGNPGTYVIQGDQVIFRGGHLDGQVGRNLNERAQFQIRSVGCEPW